jgi:hypothetical protein
MIRGHIEAVTRQRVSGWVHADARSLRDAPILAFAGLQCIGAAHVDRFRPDLLEAGVGDGYVGFEIPIAGERVTELASVVVRLEGSDACLLQPGTSVVARASGGVPLMDAEQVQAALASFRWMLAQGWIDQPDNDFLRAVTVAGSYEYAVPRTARASGRTAIALQEAAQHRLCMLNRREVALQSIAVEHVDELRAALAASLHTGVDHPVVVLCGATFAVTVTEAGHGTSALPDQEQPTIRHAMQTYQALFLDARTPVHELTIVEGAPVTLLRAQPHDPVRRA